MPAAPALSQDPALRAEHDALAARLAARASVDDVRRAAWALFGLVIAGGLAAKLGYDRWGPYRPQDFRGPPILFYLALAAALVLAVLGTVVLRRARRSQRVEDADFARLCELRALLGIEP